jgi:hypothetical protein
MSYRGIDIAAPYDPHQLMIFLRAVRDVVNNLLIGKQNVTLDVTLTPNSATTVVNYPIIGGSSMLDLGCPLTANAAAELGNGTIYVSSVGNKTATITHANNAQADRTLRIGYIG